MNQTKSEMLKTIKCSRKFKKGESIKIRWEGWMFPKLRGSTGESLVLLIGNWVTSWREPWVLWARIWRGVKPWPVNWSIWRARGRESRKENHLVAVMSKYKNLKQENQRILSKTYFKKYWTTVTLWRKYKDHPLSPRAKIQLTALPTKSWIKKLQQKVKRTPIWAQGWIEDRGAQGNPQWSTQVAFK